MVGFLLFLMPRTKCSDKRAARIAIRACKSDDYMRGGHIPSSSIGSDWCSCWSFIMHIKILSGHKIVSLPHSSLPPPPLPSPPPLSPPLPWWSPQLPTPTASATVGVASAK